jgi:hypothetical protein
MGYSPQEYPRHDDAAKRPHSDKRIEYWNSLTILNEEG